MIDLLRAKLACTPMGARLYIGGSSKSSNSNETNTTDNRQVGGDGSINIGAGARYTGTDGGAVRMAEFNTQVLKELATTSSDSVKFLTQAGTNVLDNLGGSVTDVLAKSGANMATAWSHTIDQSATIMDKLTAGSKANADAAQTVAVAALNANKSDASGLSDAFKYTAIAAAAVAALVLFRKA